MANLPQQPLSNEQSSSIDISQAINTLPGNLTYKSETAEEKTHRLKIEAAEARHKRWKSTTLF